MNKELYEIQSFQFWHQPKVWLVVGTNLWCYKIMGSFNIVIRLKWFFMEFTVLSSYSIFLFRVSIPRSTLLPSYKYKAHRRCSFDPSDSLGLPSVSNEQTFDCIVVHQCLILLDLCGVSQHCLSGWLNTGQITLPPPSSLDLRSSLNVKSSAGPQNKEVEVRQSLHTG